MPKRLIKLMELKERYLGKFFLSGAVRKDLLTWCESDVERVVKVIKDTVENDIAWAMKFDAHLCPYCVLDDFYALTDTCHGCFWMRVHGKCSIEGSLYDRYAERELFEDISREEVLSCLKD